MCTLAIYFQVFPDRPVVVAANRDEVVDRPALPPTLLTQAPAIAGGKDLKAGGTWLAINQFGVVAGLLNRRSPAPADPTLRSRGQLCLQALHYPSVEQSVGFVTRQDGAAYNPFNLLIASPHAAVVADNRGGRIRTTRLAPGLHLLTNLDVDDFECPRISAAFDRFRALCDEPALGDRGPELRARLGRILADHSTQLDPRSNRPNALCVHGDKFGTRSSSLISIGPAGGSEHFFAPGPPCVSAYARAAIRELPALDSPEAG
jgi:uncharacterized protein with NRDE domain